MGFGLVLVAAVSFAVVDCLSPEQPTIAVLIPRAAVPLINSLRFIMVVYNWFIPKYSE